MNNQNIPNGTNIPNPQQPMPNPQTMPQQPVYNVPPVMPQQVQPTVDPMSAVSNLNKEEAMEEALSHTTQYSPFQAPVSEIKQEVKKNDNKKAMIFIGIIVVIMAIFILLLPQISKLFGW